MGLPNEENDFMSITHLGSFRFVLKIKKAKGENRLMMTLKEYQIANRQRHILERLLHHTIKGEEDIFKSPIEWKWLILKNFTQIQKRTVSIQQMVCLLRERELVLHPNDKIVQEYIYRYLYYIKKSCFKL
jgi:hypothetical protein